MGITAGLESGQWSIVGGTGQFIMAQGIISFTNHPASTFEDGIKELNIRVRFTRDITQAVSIILWVYIQILVLYLLKGNGFYCTYYPTETKLH